MDSLKIKLISIESEVEKIGTNSKILEGTSKSTKTFVEDQTKKFTDMRDMMVSRGQQLKEDAQSIVTRNQQVAVDISKEAIVKFKIVLAAAGMNMQAKQEQIEVIKENMGTVSSTFKSTQESLLKTLDKTEDRFKERVADRDILQNKIVGMTEGKLGPLEEKLSKKKRKSRQLRKR